MKKVLCLFLCLCFVLVAVPALADGPGPLKRVGMVVMTVATLPYQIATAIKEGMKNPKTYPLQKQLPDGAPTVFKGVNAPVDQVMGNVPKALAYAFAPGKKVKSMTKPWELNAVCKRGLKQRPLVNMAKTLLYAAGPAASATGALPAAWGPVSQAGRVAIFTTGAAAVGSYGPAIAEMPRLES